MPPSNTDRNDIDRPDAPIIPIDSAQDNAVPVENRTSDSAPFAVSEDTVQTVNVPKTEDAPPSPIEEDASESVLLQIGSLIAWASLACLLTLINRYAGGFVPLPKYPSVAGHLLATLYLAPLLLALVQTARIAVKLPLSSPFLFIVGLLLALPALSVVFITLTRTEIPTLTYFYNILPPPLQSVINNFLGPIGLSLMGAALGRIIRHPNTLLAAAGFSIFFDIVVVTMGTVAQLMRSGSNLIAAVSVGAGAAPRALPGAPQVKLPDPISGVTIGPADVLFIALFLSSVYFLRRTWTDVSIADREKSWRETLYWMYGLLLLALVLVEVLGLPIPALVPMGIAVLLGNARLAAFTPTEKRDLVIGGCFAIFCAGLMVLWAQRAVPPALPDPGFQLAQDGRTGQVFLMEIQPKSPSAQAGLQNGDILLAINGILIKNFTNEDQLQALDKAREKGMVLRIQRRGEAKPRDVKLVFTDATKTQPTETK
jgi:hypothetical protein